MLRILKIMVFVGICVLTAPALLATEPSSKDLDSARDQSQNAVEQARRLNRDTDFNNIIRSEGERALSDAGKAGRSETPSLNTTFPDIDADTLAKAREDIKALLANPQLAAPEGSSPEDNDPHPLVFISFSMPEASLRSLLAESARTGSPLVLRGLVENSMKRTVARLGELLGTGNNSETSGKPTPSLAIDPTLFERFGVDKVPTFVLPLDTIAPCTPDGCPIPKHLKVAGDVSLAYALGVMAREADGTTLGTRAEQWRQRLDLPAVQGTAQAGVRP